MPSRSFPHDGEIPKSWYQVGYSAELTPGDVKPLKYFGDDLVLFRSESGKLSVLDAFCPHLGAHLGYGGTVTGEAIACPFHEWTWGTDGCNVNIPYGDVPKMQCQIRSWEVDERNGVIWVWYDPDGGASTWRIPELPEWAGNEVYEPFPHMVNLWPERAVHAQFIVENAVDSAHQKYVHGSADITDVESYRAEGPLFFTRQSVVFGKAKESTWLTPDGERRAHLDVETWGMGAAIARFSGTDNAVHLQTQTPVSPGAYDMRTTVYLKRGETDEPTERDRQRVSYEFRQVDNDLNIWEHQTFVAKPLLTSIERDIVRTFRRWTEQFYRAEQ